MKILHTADWHLGRSLYGRKRYDEFLAFLDWLVLTIKEERVDTLLMAGDVFDTSTPSNRAQELYYRFLAEVSTTCCRHIVVIGGNHDSPSFLNAPKVVLSSLNVSVIGAPTDPLSDEVVVLSQGDQPEAIVCGVPYLRDKDIRTAEPGETIDDKNLKLVEGVKKHYADVCEIAVAKRKELRQELRKELKDESLPPIPIIGMGHLFTAGGATVEGDGVRELYVGSLAHVSKEIFPLSLDYLALGHLHVPQSVGGAEHIRYSGSPIPMGYGEATQQKSVVLVEFTPDTDPDTVSRTESDTLTPRIQELPVPCFQELTRLVGSFDEIQTRLESLKREGSSSWLEIEYTGDEIVPNLRDRLEELIEGSEMEILRIKNARVTAKIHAQLMDNFAENETLNETLNKTLDDLNEEDVFLRFLENSNVVEEEKKELVASYNEVLNSLREEDVNAG